MPVKACSVSSCRRLAIDGKSRCEVHHKETKRRPIENDSVYYGAKWKRIASNHKSKYPICGYCGLVPAEVTDHFVELVDQGDAYNTDNLVSACHYCHNGRKTRPVRAARNIGRVELIKWYRKNAPNDRAANYVETWINKGLDQDESEPFYC